MTPKIEFLQTSKVFAHAERHIRETASELWPAAPILMQEHVPSVTSYVQRIQVGQRSLFAKLSFLGGSLVSVMRGRYGTWQQVRRAQTSYIARYDGLLRRETTHQR